MIRDDYIVPRCNICLNFGHHSDQCSQANQQNADEDRYRRQSSANERPRLFGDGYTDPCNWCGSHHHLSTQCSMANHQGNQGDPPCCVCNSPFHITKNCQIFRNMQEKEADNREGSMPFGNPETFQPSWQCSSWNSSSCNQWENRMDSFQEPALEASPSFNIKVDKQEEETQSHTERLLAKMDTLLQTYQNFKADTERVLEQHKEKISELEQAKSGSEEVITAQAKKIEMLEATVDKLGTRLQAYQKQQASEHNANLRRIKQTNVEVLNLRGQCERVQFRLTNPSQSEQINQVNQCSWSSDEEEVEVINRKSDSKGARKSVSRDEHPRVPIIQTEESPSTSSKDERTFVAKIGNDLDDEVIRQMKEIAQIQSDSISPPISQENSTQELRVVRLGAVSVIDLKKSVTPPKSTDEPSTSCSGCGLNCENQLRACVNAIKVQPSLMKVEEVEIKSMSSKQKKKLQRKWVPRGTFDIKELCRIDTILSELKCIHQVLPRVKKRQKKPPDFHDTYD